MCLLACVAVSTFRFLASSQAGQARRRVICTRHLRIPPKPGKGTLGTRLLRMRKNAHGFASKFASPPACAASFSDENRRSREGNFLCFTHGPPRVSLGPVVFLKLSSFPVFLRQKAWLLIHHGGFRGLEYQVKRKKNLTVLTEKSHGKSCFTVTFFSTRKEFLSKVDNDIMHNKVENCGFY